MFEKTNPSLPPFNLEALPVHIQLRLSVAGEHAQNRAEQVSRYMAPVLPKLQEELKAIQAPGLAPRTAMRRLRKLAAEWGEVVYPFSACKSGCAHCCHIPVHLSTLEAECIGSEISRAPRPAPKKIKPSPPGYSSPCPFLVGSKCSVYESRPLVCRVHFNMDSDDLLCKLIEGVEVPVPYADATVLKLAYWKISYKGRIADIRDFFPPLSANSGGPTFL